MSSYQKLVITKVLQSKPENNTVKYLLLSERVQMSSSSGALFPILNVASEFLYDEHPSTHMSHGEHVLLYELK